MAFGKFKKLMKKGPASPRNGKAVALGTDDAAVTATPSVTPEPIPDVRTRPDESGAYAVRSTDATSPTAARSRAAASGGGDQVPLMSGSQTDADYVLDGILQDLNITQLAVDAERTETVSEYSGGSAKSVSDEESEEDEETDEDDDGDDDEETDDDTAEDEEGEEKERVKAMAAAAVAAAGAQQRQQQQAGVTGKGKKKRSTVGDRVAAVVAAAEEIRKKRGSPTTIPQQHQSSSGRTTPSMEPGLQQAHAMGRTRSSTPATIEDRHQAHNTTKQDNLRSSKSGNSKGSKDIASKQSLPSKQSSGSKKHQQKQRGGGGGGASSPTFGKGGKLLAARNSSFSRKSPLQLPTFPKKNKTDKNSKQQGQGGGRRTTTPQFSPDIDPSSADGNDADAAKCTGDDEGTRDTQESSEDEDELEKGRGSDAEETDDEDKGGSYAEEEDDEDGTLAENTLDGTEFTNDDDRDINKRASREGGGTGSMSESVSGNGDASTFEEEEVERRKSKRTVMNKDIIIHQAGGPSSLVVRAMYYTPLPASPDDIIIKVEASTVSFRDCLLRRGIGMNKAVFPFVPGCEVVGRISNVGKQARREGYRVGDRVVGMTRRGGCNGYYAKLTTSNVSPVLNTKIDPADCVCLVDVYMTAYQALRVGKKDGTPLTDANVLITDGYSPIGQAAAALAKLEGANVYVTTTENRQDEYMKTLGVKCLPLAPSKWLHKIKGKMDIVIDNTCFDSYDSSWKALNAHGVLVCTGMTSIYSFQDSSSAAGCGGCDAFGDIRDYQARWAAVKAKYMMSHTKFHDLWESFQSDPKKYQQELKYLCFLVDSGMLKPKIAERVNIEEIPDAQRYLETGKANGTIVCLP